VGLVYKKARNVIIQLTLLIGSVLDVFLEEKKIENDITDASPFFFLLSFLKEKSVRHLKQFY